MAFSLLPSARTPAPPAADPYSHPAWREHRARFEKRIPAVCIACRRTRRDGAEMHVHHLRYDERHDRGDVRRLLVPHDDLVWLCAEEHDRVTALHTRTPMDHATATAYYLSQSWLERRRLLWAALVRRRVLALAAAVARWLLLTVVLTVLLVAGFGGGATGGLLGDGVSGDATLAGLVAAGWLARRRLLPRRRRARVRLIRAIGLAVVVGYAASRVM